MQNEANLNFVAYTIICAFKETGLDEAYIQEKTNMFLQHHNKEQSLAWACNYLDNKNLKIFALKLGVTTEMLRITAKVLSKI